MNDADSRRLAEQARKQMVGARGRDLRRPRWSTPPLPPAPRTPTPADPFVFHHKLDADGNPAGGSTFGQGFAIAWQDGPLGREGERTLANGAFVEHVIEAAINRLAFYQSTKFAHPRNAQALEHLKAAIGALQMRTVERQARGVEGTHEP